MEKINPQINSEWLQLLKEEFASPYFLDLRQFLEEEKRKYRIFPPGPSIFAAFNHTPVSQVKVVILGQDPYHGAGQANGLSFSVNDGIRKPPSLVNIFKEQKEDLGHEIPGSGNLENWSRQGVLLLNATLTVRENAAGSHQDKGWEIFTDAAIRKLAEVRRNLVFLLWGNYAKKKAAFIDTAHHLVLNAPHPSPLARGGFSGCRHFSRANEFLIATGQQPVNWKLG